MMMKQYTCNWFLRISAYPWYRYVTDNICWNSSSSDRLLNCTPCWTGSLVVTRIQRQLSCDKSLTDSGSKLYNDQCATELKENVDGLLLSSENGSCREVHNALRFTRGGCKHILHFPLVRDLGQRYLSSFMLLYLACHLDHELLMNYI